MKKKLLFTFFALASVVMCATAVSIDNKTSGPNFVKATDGETTQTTYIEFNADNFEVVDGGNLVIEVGEPNGATFWGSRRYNAVGPFFNGFHNDGLYGEIRTKGTFLQTEKYVCFTLGGNPWEDNSNSSEVKNYVALRAADGTQIATAHHSHFEDPRLCCNMLTYVIEVPDEYLNTEMYISIHDNKTGGWGGISFGNLHVNQDVAGVAAQIARHRASLIWTNQGTTDGNSNTWNYAAAAYTESLYMTEDNYKYFIQNGYDASYFPNEDFEDQNNWYSDWKFDTSYARWSNIADTERNSEFAWSTDFNPVLASSDASSQMVGEYDTPYNKDGNRFFNGPVGYSIQEASSYRLVSHPFKLVNDFITVKMAGRVASLQLIDAYTYDVVAEITNQSFRDGDLGTVYKNDAGLVTMKRHVWNVSAFKNGNENNPNGIYILAMADREHGTNWGCAFFDSIKFSDNPGFKVDAVKQYDNTGAWHNEYVYSSYNDSVDASGYTEAHNFLNNIGNVEITVDEVATNVDLTGRGFYDIVRGEANNGTFCGTDYHNGNEMVALKAAYNALSGEAKAVLATAEDYQFEGAMYTSNIIKVEPTSGLDITVGGTMNYISGYNGYVTSTEVSGLGNIFFKENSVTIAFVILAVITAVAIGGFFFVKKRYISK